MAPRGLSGWRRVREIALPLAIIVASVLASPSDCGVAGGSHADRAVPAARTVARG